MSRASIAIGAYLGDRAARLRQALVALGSEPGLKLVRASSLYETAPVGGPPQGPFLNACALFETTLRAEVLMGCLLAIERRAVRIRGAPLGPRTLDLDLLLMGEDVIRGPGIEVPHPRMAERAFVLAPAAEIAGAMRHPLLMASIDELRRRLPSEAGVRLLARSEGWA